MTQPRILVVEDDPKIRVLLRRCLQGEGYDVREASDVSSTMKCLEADRPDLITLDLQLGADDGIEVAKQIRARSAVPIIMVTGKDDVIDRVVGLEVGADDYITKPFHVREVIARVKSVLRRAQMTRTSTSLACGCQPPCQCGQARGSEPVIFDGLEMTPDRFELLGRDGKPVDLTSGDFRLLQVFVEHPKRVLSREHLMDLVGGGSWAPLDRTIDNQVSRLRRKIERDPANPVLIKTVRGVGYSFTGDVGIRADRSLASTV